MSSRPSIELTGNCPYCEYTWAIECRDIRGERHALRCIDCGEMCVVEVEVTATPTVHSLAGVDRDAILDRLIARMLPREARQLEHTS